MLNNLFRVTTSKKRATTKFTAQDGSYTGNVKTACADGQAQISDTCSKYPTLPSDGRHLGH